MFHRYIYIFILILTFSFFSHTALWAQNAAPQSGRTVSNFYLGLDYIDKYHEAKNQSDIHKEIRDRYLAMARKDKTAATKYHQATRQYEIYLNERNRYAKALSALLPQLTEADMQYATLAELDKLASFYFEVNQVKRGHHIKTLMKNTKRPTQPKHETPSQNSAAKGPYFKDLPAATEVHVITVHQSKNVRPISQTLRSGNTMGNITVDIRAENRPIFLVLAAYEPVDWKLKLANNTQIVGILSSGYFEQRIFNIPPHVPTLDWSKIKGQDNLYFLSSEKPSGRLQNAVTNATHKRMRSLQEQDKADYFIIR